MVEVPHAFDIIELSAAERLLSVSADVAMLWAVVEDPDPADMAKVQSELFRFCTAAYGSSAPAQLFWDSVSADTISNTLWRDLMIKAAAAIPSRRQAIVMADLCIDSSYITDDSLVAGVGCRRLNGILDLLALPFCAADVQDYFSTLADNLASMKLNNVHETAAMTASFTGGAVGGFLFMPFIGSATVRGVEYFLGDVTKADACSIKSAHLLACAVAANQYEDGSPDVVLVRDYLERLAVKAAQEFAFGRSHSANIYTGDTAHADRHRKVVTAAFSVAQELVSPEKVTVPDVVGMPYSAAHDLLVAAGIEVYGTASNDRSIMNKNNWVVSEQRTLPGREIARGKTVTLEVRKFSD